MASTASLKCWGRFMTSIQASGGFAVQPSVGVCVGVVAASAAGALGGVSSPGLVARQRCGAATARGRIAAPATARGRRSAAPPRAARRACLSSSITAGCSHCKFTRLVRVTAASPPASTRRVDYYSVLAACTRSAVGSRALRPARCRCHFWLGSSLGVWAYAAVTRDSAWSSALDDAVDRRCRSLGRVTHAPRQTTAWPCSPVQPPRHRRAPHGRHAPPNKRR